jgi:hypothetical protein
MGKPSRDKGARGEREVAAIFQAAGFDCARTPNSGGLHVPGDLVWKSLTQDPARSAMRAPAFTLHVETKRTETFHRSFIRQAEAEAPQGTVPVLCWRPSREPWRCMLPLTDFVTILRGET